MIGAQRTAIFGGFPQSAQARAFLARTSGQDGRHRREYTKLINGLVKDGVWPILDAIYTGASVDSATGLKSLISSTNDASLINSPTFTADQGFTGNGSNAAINSNTNPSTAGGNMAQDSNCIFFWSGTSGQENGISCLGSLSDGTFKIVLITRDSSDLAQYRMNSSSSIKTVANTDGSGLYAINRSSSSAVQLYKNGVLLDSATQTSAALVSSNLVFLRCHTTQFSSRLMRACGFGGSLNAAQHAALYARLHTYLQNIAGIV